MSLTLFPFLQRSFVKIVKRLELQCQCLTFEGPEENLENTDMDIAAHAIA